MKRLTAILLILCTCITAAACGAKVEEKLPGVAEGLSSEAETETESVTEAEKLKEEETEKETQSEKESVTETEIETETEAESKEQTPWEYCENRILEHLEKYSDKEWFFDIYSSPSFRWDCEDIRYEDMVEDFTVAHSLIEIFEYGLFDWDEDDKIVKEEGTYGDLVYYRINCERHGFDLDTEEEFREIFLKYFTADFTDEYIKTLIRREQILFYEGKTYVLPGGSGMSIDKGESIVRQIYPHNDGYELVVLTEVIPYRGIRYTKMIIGYVRHTFHLEYERDGWKFTFMSSTRRPPRM